MQIFDDEGALMHPAKRAEKQPDGREHPRTPPTVIRGRRGKRGPSSARSGTKSASTSRTNGAHAAAALVRYPLRQSGRSVGGRAFNRCLHRRRDLRACVLGPVGAELLQLGYGQRRLRPVSLTCSAPPTSIRASVPGRCSRVASTRRLRLPSGAGDRVRRLGLLRPRRCRHAQRTPARHARGSRW
jgi:hypothetical protein